MDLLNLKDFLLTGVLVSIIRPLVTDIFDILFFNEVAIGELCDLPSSNRRCHSEKKGSSKHIMDSSQNKDQFVFKRGNRTNYDNQGNYMGSNYNKDTFYEKLKDKTKRRLTWVVWKQHTDKYVNYDEFKKSWKTGSKIREEIKKDVVNSKELKYLKKIKRTVAWLFNPKG